MRIASWNIKGNNGVGIARRGELVAALVAVAPDVILLQEVAWKDDLHVDLTTRLAAAGWPHVFYGGAVGSTTKRYGNLLASKFPVTADESEWAPGLPWKQALARVTVHSPDGDFVAIAAHIPNGSGNGWGKIETFEALTAGLAAMESTTAVVVAGDFNEPKLVLDSGTVVPFGSKLSRTGEWQASGNLRGACGRTFPRHRWVNAVRAILGEEPAVDLNHTARLVEGPSAWHTTHEIRGKARYFDHILVSSHWDVQSVGFDHEVRTNGTSDHSLVWADVLPSYAGRTSGGVLSSTVTIESHHTSTIAFQQFRRLERQQRR